MRWIALALLTFVTTAQAQQPRLLIVQLSVSVGGGDRPQVSGTTNLPNGSIMIAALGSAEMKFSATVPNAVVREGRFQFQPFSNNGSVLSPGFYTLRLQSQSIMVAPEISAVIGPSGSNLIGPNVGDTVGRSILYSQVIAVGR